METINYIPPEALENQKLETRITEALDNLGSNIESFYGNIKDNSMTNEKKEKVLERFDRIKLGLLPILAKSASFGVNQYKNFSDLARRTNYSSMDSQGRQVIMLSDTTFSLIARALVDTKEYINNLKI